MRILSGLKPTGNSHVGNYFGAIRQWIELQNEGDGFYFIADLHALDGERNAETMREYTLAAALDYMALGLDPERCTLFVQSAVPEVSELMWILGSVTPMGLLNRAHAYKAARDEARDPDFGLFAYPVLMAADILLYRSDVVPVGKDQKQHVEIARDIAVKFNQTYCPDFDPATGSGGVLTLPADRIMPATAIVPGTDGRKMSKSYGNTIALFAPEKQVKQAIMGIVTDSTPIESPKDPEQDNVFALLRLFTPGPDLDAIAAEYRHGGVGYGEFKKQLLDLFHAAFADARAKRLELESNLDHVSACLARGAVRAREVAGEVLGDVKRACGLTAD